MIKRGIILAVALMITARSGIFFFDGHKETYYNLNMNRIVARADMFYGLSDVYEVREDGVKTYNGFVMVASDWNIHPFGSVVETSRGTGIVLDMHTAKDREIIDIATAW